jgi:hypothetical protein
MAWFSKKPQLSSTRNEIIDLKRSVSYLNSRSWDTANQLSGIESQIKKLEDIHGKKNLPLEWIMTDISRLTEQVEDLLHVLAESGVIERDTDLVVESVNGAVWRSKNAE